MPPHSEASPTGQTDGHRAAHDSAVVSSLRSALRDVYERYRAYKERSETLEAEASRKLGAFAAETAGMLRQWGSDANITGAYVEAQLQARNGQHKNMEGREADRQISNRASFEADLLSILEEIVSKDGKILERKSPPEDTMSVDEIQLDTPQPPQQPSQLLEKAKPAEQTTQTPMGALGTPAQSSSTRSTRKRQLELDSPRTSGQPESPRIKRTKRASEAAKAMAETLGTQPGESLASFPRNSPGVVLPGKGAGSRKITYEEVYQDGKANQKHAIITHPCVPPGTWFILKCECDDHVVHFGPPKSALIGASKHLDTGYHKLTRSRKDAIEHLGWEVLGCDPEKAAANNAAFEQALRQGYIPVNTRHNGNRKWFDGAGTSYARSPVEPDPATSTPAKVAKVAPAKASPTKNAPITRAKGGELYYAWWPDDEKYYLCMIMPWDNSRDFGLHELRQGIHGLGLLDNKQTRVPRCYSIDFDLEPPRIVGWSEDYEDGGPMESKRVFPALFFHTPNKKNQSAWTKASFLRAFDWRNPNFEVPGYKLNRQSVKRALEAMAKARGFPSFAQFEIAQGAGALGERARDGATTVPAQNGDGQVQDEIQVVDEEDESSLGEAQPKDGDEPDASPPDKGPEEAQTTKNAAGEVQTDVSQPTTESAPSPAENQAKSEPPAKQPEIQDKSPVGASESQSKTVRNETTANGTASPAPAGVTRAAQSEAPPKSSSPAGNRSVVNGRSYPVTTDATTKPQATKSPETTEAATDATKKSQAAKQPNAAGALVARRLVPGKKTPTMAATPPVTPAGSRPGAGLLPKPNTVNSPSTTPASSKIATGSRSVAGLPPKPPDVGSLSATAASSKVTANTQSPAATPAQTPLAKPAQNTPATNPPNGQRIQTQLAPSSQAGPQNRSSPAVSPAISPAKSLRSASTPRNAAAATGAQRFYLSEYEGPDTFWNAVNDSERLVLEIDPKTQTAKTGQGVPLEIDPNRVTSHAQFRDRPEPGKHTLTLNMKDSKTETVKEHRLVFDQGGGVAASRQARRFFSWVSGW